MKQLAIILFLVCASFYLYSQSDTVIFSASGGFYNNSFYLALQCNNPNNKIYYTTNGNTPTAQSNLYTHPLFLDETLYSKSDIYKIVNCPPTDFYLPDYIKHCIVIRAAVFDENDSCTSNVVTNSYLIKALGCDTHGLSVVSLCSDSLGLFDNHLGIMVPGENYDPLYPYSTGNYFNKGREWERLCNIEFHEYGNNLGINQLVGIRMHGNQARWHNQKGMKIYARDEYGKKRLKYKFFETIPEDNFKHLCLKPYMNAWNGSGCKDYICERIAEQMDVESLASRPIVLFLNGEYWGIYYLEEKPDERFLEDHFSIDIDSVNIIDNWINLECGSADEYFALFSWMETADLSDAEQYAYADAHIDISNFIDYYVLELFVANIDWPSTNSRMWQLANGKWRWIFYDGDACLEDYNFDVFANATYNGDNQYPSSRKATLFFRRFMENEQFRQLFAQRFIALLYSTLSYRNTKPYFDEIKAKIKHEIYNQMERWGEPPSSYEEWVYYCMNVINIFLEERPQQMMNELSLFLGIEKPTFPIFQCYPNPFSDKIYILLDSDYGDIEEIQIYNIQGKIVLSQSCNLNKGINEIMINPNLETGCYILKLGCRTFKIIKL